MTALLLLLLRRHEFRLDRIRVGASAAVVIKLIPQLFRRKFRCAADGALTGPEGSTSTRIAVVMVATAPQQDGDLPADLPQNLREKDETGYL